MAEIYTVKRAVGIIRAKTGSLGRKLTDTMIKQAIYDSLLNFTLELNEGQLPELVDSKNIQVEIDNEILISDPVELPIDVLKVLSARVKLNFVGLNSIAKIYELRPVVDKNDFFNNIRSTPQQYDDIFYLVEGSEIYVQLGENAVRRFGNNLDVFEITLKYFRRPGYPANDSDKIDYPDRYMPQIIALAIKQLAPELAQSQLKEDKGEGK